MAKRASTSIKIINLTEDELSYWSQFVFRYYRDNGKDQNKSDDKLKKFILSTLQECMNGWERCPKKFEHRVGLKFDIPKSVVEKKDAGNLKVEEGTVRRGRPIKSELSNSDILDLLSPKEREHWLEKERKYIKDYELNGVSDMILVRECIVEEIILQKLNSAILADKKGIDTDSSKLKKEAIERMQSMHRSLGILKEQRDKEMSDLDGNIAQAAQELDKKKELIKQLEEEDRMEEEKAIRDKESNPPVNELPDEAKIRAIVGENEEG